MNVEETLRERARILAAPIEDEADYAVREVLFFELGQERFAIEGAFVREVFPLRHITLVPCTPGHILGITNLRGELVTVLDVKQFFGMNFSGLTNFNKVVVVQGEETTLGLLVDNVFGMGEIRERDLHEKLPTFSDQRSDYITGITSEPAMLLDIARLLADPRLVVDEETRR